MFELLIANGADVNASDEFGRTALMIASKQGHFETVSLLIKNNADVNAVDHNGWTALKWADNEGASDIIDLLISKGAKVYIDEGHVRTPLIDYTDDDHGWTALINFLLFVLPLLFTGYTIWHVKKMQNYYPRSKQDKVTSVDIGWDFE